MKSYQHIISRGWTHQALAAASILLGFENGTLYGVESSNTLPDNTVYTINTSTGVGTLDAGRCGRPAGSSAGHSKCLSQVH